MTRDTTDQPDETDPGHPADAGPLDAPEQWLRGWSAVLSLQDWQSAVDVLGVGGLEEYRTLFTELPADHRSRVVFHLESFRGKAAGQAVLSALARASFMVEDAQCVADPKQGEQGGGQL